MVATIAIIEKLIVDISKSVNEYATIYVASDMMEYVILFMDMFLSYG